MRVARSSDQRRRAEAEPARTPMSAAMGTQRGEIEQERRAGLGSDFRESLAGDL